MPSLKSTLNKLFFFIAPQSVHALRSIITDIVRRKIYENELNYITLTVVAWIDIFTRRIYNDFLMDSLQFCRKE